MDLIISTGKVAITGPLDDVHNGDSGGGEQTEGTNHQKRHGMWCKIKNRFNKFFGVRQIKAESKADNVMVDKNRWLESGRRTDGPQP